MQAYTWHPTNKNSLKQMSTACSRLIPVTVWLSNTTKVCSGLLLSPRMSTNDWDWLIVSKHSGRLVPTFRYLLCSVLVVFTFLFSPCVQFLRFKSCWKHNGSSKLRWLTCFKFSQGVCGINDVYDGGHYAQWLWYLCRPTWVMINTGVKSIRVGTWEYISTKEAV